MRRSQRGSRRAPVAPQLIYCSLPGFGRDRFLKLEPFVTALPQGTAINLCSARIELLNAFGPPGTINFSDPDSLTGTATISARMRGSQNLRR